jgi:hypothetical protein
MVIRGVVHRIVPVPQFPDDLWDRDMVSLGLETR